MERTILVCWTSLMLIFCLSFVIKLSCSHEISALILLLYSRFKLEAFGSNNLFCWIASPIGFLSYVPNFYFFGKHNVKPHGPTDNFI